MPVIPNVGLLGRLPVTRGDRLVATLRHPNVGRNFVINALVEEDGGRITAIEQVGITDSTTSRTRISIPLPKGLLLTASLQGTEAGMVPGEVYSQLALRGGSLTTSPLHYLLCEGYISARASIAWPYPPSKSPLWEQPGPERQLVANPAAGADWTVSVPGQQLRRVISVYMKLVTDANVANRQPILRAASVAGDIIWEIEVAASQTASQTRVYMFARTMGSQFNGVSNNRHFPLPDTQLQGADVLRTVTTGIQVGDQYSLVAISWERIDQDN